MTFFSTLFGIKLFAMILYFDKSDNNAFKEEVTDDENQSCKISEYLKVTTFSLYKIMYCILHSDRKKVPLHVMTAHDVYNKCKSRDPITTLNHIGVSVSYRQIWKSKS